MRRLCFVLISLVGGTGTACLSNPPTTPQRANAYAVVYGRVGAPKLTSSIQVYLEAFDDSAHALAGGTTGYLGLFPENVTAADSYYAFIPASVPGTYFLDVSATGIGQKGFVSSVDTVRGVRLRFDSIGGGPHDSVEVDDSLP
jgi:hypothetical protein